MRIKEFSEEISKGIESRVAGVKAVPTKTLKNNGVTLHGILFRKEKEAVSPVLYLDQWFKKYKNGEVALEDVVEWLMNEYMALPDHDIPDMEKYLSSEEFINTITIHLVSKEQNKKMIDNRSLVSYELKGTDLVCLFYAEIEFGDHSVGEMAITEYLLYRYLPAIDSAEELFRTVLNRVDNSTVRLEPMKNIVNLMIEEITGETSDLPLQDVMFVLSNQGKYGASTILTEKARRLILEKFPNGMATVLPSSLHELIIIPTAEEEDVEVLKAMVTQVNKTELKKEDVLSNNVYHYDANTGTLKIAETTESEVMEE